MVRAISRLHRIVSEICLNGILAQTVSAIRLKSSDVLGARCPTHSLTRVAATPDIVNQFILMSVFFQWISIRLELERERRGGAGMHVESVVCVDRIEGKAVAGVALTIGADALIAAARIRPQPLSASEVARDP